MQIVASWALALTLAVCLIGTPTAAHAADHYDLNAGDKDIRIRAWKQNQAKVKAPVRAGAGEQARQRSSRTGTASAAPRYTYVPKDEYQTRLTAYQKNLDRVIARNSATATAQDTCTNSATGLACNGGQYVDLPGDFNLRPAADPADPAAAPAPVVTPQQAAYIAATRLRLTTPKPMIGPSPSINPWKMAAVGYPMWLWADTNPNPAPVLDSVYDLTVSLDARLVKVVYDMGDGHKVSCTDVTRNWTRAVPAAAPSPACGYTYQQPSLPDRTYTITANAIWAVDWTVNTTTGTIPFFQSASTQLPVGELQVLNR